MMERHSPGGSSIPGRMVFGGWELNSVGRCRVAGLGVTSTVTFARRAGRPRAPLCTRPRAGASVSPVTCSHVDPEEDVVFAEGTGAPLSLSEGKTVSTCNWAHWQGP